MRIKPPTPYYLRTQKAILDLIKQSADKRDRRTLAVASAMLAKLCYDAHASPIADNPHVLANLRSLLDAVNCHLGVRVDAQKAGFLEGFFKIRPVFNRTSEAIDHARFSLITAIRAAWIEAAGRDPRDDDSYHDQFDHDDQWGAFCRAQLDAAGVFTERELLEVMGVPSSLRSNAAA